VFPTPHTVEHAAASRTGENALGQATVTYTVRQRAVIGWSPKSTTDDPTADLAGRVITEVYLSTPDGDWSDGDLVTLPDGFQFVVVGDPEDNNTGPFGFKPGYRVTLRRVHDGPA